MQQLIRSTKLYLGAYLLGIGTAIAATPIELDLAGTALWSWYLAFSLIGFLMFYSIPFNYMEFGNGFLYALLVAAGLIPILLGVVTFFRWPRLRSWRPILIAFPVGFVGAIGVYYTVAASI